MSPCDTAIVGVVDPLRRLGWHAASATSLLPLQSSSHSLCRREPHASLELCSQSVRMHDPWGHLLMVSWHGCRRGAVPCCRAQQRRCPAGGACFAGQSRRPGQTGPDVHAVLSAVQSPLSCMTVMTFRGSTKCRSTLQALRSRCLTARHGPTRRQTGHSPAHCPLAGLVGCLSMSSYTGPTFPLLTPRLQATNLDTAGSD